MRIGLITYYFPPESYASAARVGPIAEAWANAGDTVHVFTHRLMQDAEDDIADDENIQLHRTPFGSADNEYSLPVRFLAELVFCLSAAVLVLRRRVDILVCTSPPFLVAVMTLLLGRVTGTPYVVDVRDLHPEQLFAYGVIERDSALGRFLQWLEKQIYDHALLIIGVTEGLCRHIEERTHTDVVLIRNGIDTRRFFRQHGPSPRKDSFVVVFHGTLARSQNVELLLRYGERLKRTGMSDVTIRVIGDGMKADALVRGIDRRGLKDYVDYLGAIDFDNIPDHLNQADVGLSPRVDGYVNETAFPVKIYECLGCGLPVVVTPESEAGRYVEKHEVGFQHSNGDVEGVHESILRLMSNPQLYAEYSDRAVRIAKSFDRHALGRKLRHEIANRLETAVNPIDKFA